MAEKKIKWTEQQERAIGTRGSDVLVTASAGTGKTAVLSGRYVDLVSREAKFGDVRNILVVTFTEMAAEQMRSRIAEQLRALASERKDRRLAAQLVLLDGADISTIHSFCKRLITEYFYELGLDPRFGIIDGDEQKLLKAEMLEKTIEWAWEEGNLAAGMEQLLYRRDLRTSEGFLSKVIGLSDFLDGVISRERWLERAVYLSGAVSPFACELGGEQRKLVGKKLGEILEQLVATRELYQSEGGSGKWLSRLEDDFIRPVAKCIEFLEARNWDGCAAGIRNFGTPTVRKPNGLEEEVGEVIRKTVKGAVDDLKGLCGLAVMNPDYADRVGGAVSLQTKILVELVKKFDEFYGEAKKAVNRLDFADLEHYALRLLSRENAVGETAPSETALTLREKYKYIFVDEYQDINPVQQAIIKMLSRGDNVFVVGDIKQSIYAFRGAEPGIFLERLKAAVPEPEVGEGGVRVELNMNWRSVKGILDFVNKVFGRIMTGSFVDIDYDDSAKLRPGMEEQEREVEGPTVELHILDEQGVEEEGTEDTAGGDENIISSRQRQAMMIARRIRRMAGADGGVAEFQVYDKRVGGYRNVEYGDIVILMRSPAKRADDYVEVLRLAGVPVSCESSAGYFEATEISDCICLLKVLDNPQRDIELAAVLRSPFFRISDDELAKIRLHGKAASEEGGFYASVCEYAMSGEDSELVGRLREILARIEKWREVGRSGKPADLLWRVYRETGFLSFVSALPSGKVRRANLLKLHERAIQFEGFASSGGVFSLARFVEFIEKLREAGGDWSGAEPESEAEEAVRIISVHKSKGLEFPVVFLAELNSRFNTKDIGGDILADSGDILGLQVIEKRGITS